MNTTIRGFERSLGSSLEGNDALAAGAIARVIIVFTKIAAVCDCEKGTRCGMPTRLETLETYNNKP